MPEYNQTDQIMNQTYFIQQREVKKRAKSSQRKTLKVMVALTSKTLKWTMWLLELITILSP